MPQDTDDYKYKVNLPWRHGASVSEWNLKCAWAIEKFGLPGDKFVCHATENHMDFYFKEERDAIHFSLVCL